MPEGGQLTIATDNRTLDAAYCALNLEATPGEYVCITITDNGEGIAFKHQEHVFEPFFTTKHQGKGTGLGLAMVFGFVKRAKGHITLDSKPGVGTTFQLYLPRTEGEEQPPPPVSYDEPLDRSPKGHETILAVDDELELLELVEELLQSLGYRVLTASNGKQALERLAENPNITLLFSDVVMPGMLSGYQLAQQATADRPDLKVLLASGYTEKAVADSDQERFNVHLLKKPYTELELAQRLRLLLDGSEAAEVNSKASDQPSQPPAVELTRWSDAFSIGIDSLDEDHHKLLELLNRCQRVEVSDADGRELEFILAELVEYTHFHFGREETVMRVCNYPGLSRHREVHQLLIKQVNTELRRLAKGHLDIHELLRFLNDWLVDHIQGMDHAIIPYCEGKSDLIETALEQLEAPS